MSESRVDTEVVYRVYVEVPHHDGRVFDSIQGSFPHLEAARDEAARRSRRVGHPARVERVEIVTTTTVLERYAGTATSDAR